MAYKYSTGSLRQGDLYFEDDRAGEPTYIDWGQDTITFRPSGSAILYLESGKVGIGTTSPDYALDVAGDVGVNEYIYHNGDADTFIRFQDDDIVFKAGNVNFIKLTENDDQDKLICNDGRADLDFIVRSPNEDLALYLNADNEVFHINHTETSFKTKIHSTNGEAITVNDSGVILNEDGAAANDFRVESDGEDEALFVDASSNTLYINKGATGFTTVIKSTNEEAIRVGASGVILNQYGHASNDFRVESDNVTHMLFVDAGNDNVGIGVTDPDTTLEVGGSVHLSDEVATPSAPSDTDGGILYVKTDGKIYWISNELSETDLTAGAGGGQTNTASNLGDSDDGEGLFSAKSGVDLEFKRIKGGVGTALTSETNDLLIDSLTRIKQEGCKFSYTDAETITLSPNGLDSKATVGILSGTTFSAVELSADLTCDLSTSGAGGLDTGAEANSTGYYVFVITQAAGATPALLCSTSDSAPTMPTDYVYQSEPIWFISNDSSGDLVDFVDMNGKCFYREPAAVLANGLGYSAWTLINCSSVAPNNSVAFVEAWVRPKSTTAWNSLRFHWSNANAINSTFFTLRYHNVIRNVNGSGGTEHMAGNFPLVDASAGMYYQWGSDPGSGGAYPPSFNVWLRGWTLL